MSSDLPLISIEPSTRWKQPDLREVWEHRDLLYALAWRDIKVRYRQTVIGAAWAILQPVLSMVVLSVVFGRLAGVATNDIPYPVFTYSALVPWAYFTHAITMATSSVSGATDMITSAYFPRLILPLAAVLGALVDFLFAFLILLLLMLFYGLVPTVAVFTLPLFTLLALTTAAAVGLWLAALNVEYRDIVHAVPFLMQLWFFATPVAYPSSLIPEPWRAVYGLNPMAGVVEGFRWALLGSTEHPPGAMLLISVGAVAGLAIGGLYFFRRREETFADVV